MHYWSAVAVVAGAMPPPPANRPPISVAQASAATAYSSQSLQLRAPGAMIRTEASSAIAGFRPAGRPSTLAGADTATATFIVPPLVEPTTLSFTLTVTDNGGLSATQSLTIAVAPADVQLTASVSGGKSFTSDQLSVPLQLTGATLLGNPSRQPASSGRPACKAVSVLNLRWPRHCKCRLRRASIP